MEYSFREENKIGIFELSGSLMGEHDGIPIMEAFTEKIDEGYRNFIISMKDLKHMNSMGIGVLITLLTRARKAKDPDGELLLAGPSKHIQNLLLITKLNTIFKMYDEEVEALEYFKERN